MIFKFAVLACVALQASANFYYPQDNLNLIKHWTLHSDAAIKGVQEATRLNAEDEQKAFDASVNGGRGNGGLTFAQTYIPSWAKLYANQMAGWNKYINTLQDHQNGLVSASIYGPSPDSRPAAQQPTQNQGGQQQQPAQNQGGQQQQQQPAQNQGGQQQQQQPAQNQGGQQQQQPAQNQQPQQQQQQPAQNQQPQQQQQQPAQNQQPQQQQQQQPAQNQEPQQQQQQQPAQNQEPQQQQQQQQPAQNQ